MQPSLFMQYQMFKEKPQTPKQPIKLTKGRKMLPRFYDLIDGCGS